MSLNIPANVTVIFDRIAADLQNELDELDPFLRNSVIRALSASFANAFFETYKTLQQLELLTFWDTTTGESLERWAAIWGIIRNPATKATGFVTFTGVDTSVIPISTQFSSSSGDLYETLAASAIAATTLSVTSITRVAQIATVTTDLDHGLASGMDVVISGAVETEYNGTFEIIVTSLNSFTYEVVGTPTTPATGTILVDASFANVEAESLDFGADQNLLSGTAISLASPLAGVDSEGFVSFDEIAGGTDVETDDSLRDRFLFRIQNPIALFNENAIINQAKLVPGVTRVFVQNVDSLFDSVTPTSITRSGDFATVETASNHGLFDGQVVTVVNAIEPEYNQVNAKTLVINAVKFGYVVPGTPSTPATGSPTVSFAIASEAQVIVIFVRDNDVDIIPTPSEVQDVKDKLLEIKYAPMSESDLIVAAPIAVTVDFTFTELIPNTSAMQTAITANLQSFFRSGTEVAKDISQIDYESIINSTLDSGGNPVTSFTLSTPTGDIPIGPTEIGVLGTIIYP